MDISKDENRRISFIILSGLLFSNICEKEKYNQFDSFFVGTPFSHSCHSMNTINGVPAPNWVIPSNTFPHHSLSRNSDCARLWIGAIRGCLTASDPLCWFTGFQSLPGDMRGRGFRFDRCDPNVAPRVFIFGKLLLTITFVVVVLKWSHADHGSFFHSLNCPIRFS